MSFPSLISCSQTEVLDCFSASTSEEFEATPVNHDNVSTNDIRILSTSFTWTSDNDGSGTPGPNRRNFVLRIEGEVAFKPGCINLIVGPTGCGKTSLLMALLGKLLHEKYHHNSRLTRTVGEMHPIPSGLDSLVSLPRERGVAFHAQESWVLNETIRVRAFSSTYSFF